MPERVPSLPPTPQEQAEHAARDVGAADLGSLVAHVCVNSKERTVSLLLDEHTAGVLMYAARLLCADYEAHKQEPVPDRVIR